LAGFVAALSPFIKNEQSKIISLFGRASFPFFLLHGPAMTFVNARFGSNILAWILYFVFCWAAALIFMLTLEKARRRRAVRSALTNEARPACIR
jgi:peptidoglycan/LPS O-acetylase OafA/YrhL